MQDVADDVKRCLCGHTKDSHGGYDETDCGVCSCPNFRDPIPHLVGRFMAALHTKLEASEAKYGWNNAWADPSRVEAQQADLVAHVAKGDPLDVAAYCAFLWYHGASTVPSKTPCATCGDMGQNA